MERLVCREIRRVWPDLSHLDDTDIALSMSGVYEATGRRFVVVVDEWDAPIRERPQDEEGHRAYFAFLRDWLTDREFLALVYMTGILPIKRYGAHSALSMFDEYSMVSPLQFAPYTGFTECEVKALCERWGRDFGSLRDWYDGYEVEGAAPPGGQEIPRWTLYSPLSVSKAIRTGKVYGWWAGTETLAALAAHIRRDLDGLEDRVALLMDGEHVPVSLATYQNDMSSLSSADDVLAMLVHLGYLAFDEGAQEVYIPNREVLEVFHAATKDYQRHYFTLGRRVLPAVSRQPAHTS